MQERNPRVRLLALGHPKAGKTGMLAALVNSGRFEIGLLDFDHNPDPLYTYVLPEFRDRVSIVTLEDELVDNGKRIVVKGTPKAFTNAGKALDQWVDDEGKDWGPVKEWQGGLGTKEKPARVLVMDSLTSSGDAAFRRRRFLRPSGVNSDDQQSDWKAAMDDQMFLFERLATPRFSCHVIAMSHIKTIEPKIMIEARNDSEDIKAAKQAISRLRAENAEVRKCPSALGQSLPPEIARFLPAVILVDGNRRGKRVLVTKPEDGLDLGVPAKGLKAELPQDSGLLTIFDAILGEERGEEE